MATDLAERTALGDGGQPGRRPRRRWPLVGGVVAVLVVGALVATGALLASTPRLETGSFYVNTPTLKVANHGYQDTRFVVDGESGGVLHVSVRNSSRFSVTILGLAATPHTPSSLRGITFEANPLGIGVGQRAQVVRQVTLRPGAEAGVLLDVRFPDCVSYSRGGSAIYDFIPVRVRRMGVTHTASIPLQLPLWVYAATDHPAQGTCTS